MSGIVLAFYLIIESPVYITVFFLSFVVVVMYAFRRRLLNMELLQLSAVAPLSSSSIEHDNEPEEDLIDISISSDSSESSRSKSIRSSRSLESLSDYGHEQSSEGSSLYKSPSSMSAESEWNLNPSGSSSEIFSP